MWRIVAAWRRGGARTAARTAVGRLNDWLTDRWTGVSTSGLVPIETLIDDWNGCHDYFPSCYAELRSVLASFSWDSQDVFVDIGAGKGRALLVAGEYPFRSVIGVEISPTLCQTARSNLARNSSKLACRDVQVIEADASEWPIPDTATIFYLYNPMKGERLTRLFAAIAASLASAPRTLWIVYNNPFHFEPLEPHYSWLKREAVHNFEYRWIVYRAGSPAISEEMSA